LIQVSHGKVKVREWHSAGVGDDAILTLHEGARCGTRGGQQNCAHIGVRCGKDLGMVLCLADCAVPGVEMV
jgi:hypothetical protein